MLDYLIVGQGIAGSLLGHVLIKNKKKIKIIDDGDPCSSSLVAAGIFNPVTGKRKVKTWLADRLFSFLHTFYPELEKEINSTFYHLRPIYMLFESTAQQNVWSGKLSSEEFRDILDINTNPALYGEYIHDQYGAIISKISGFIDVKEMLEGLKKWFLEKEVLYQSKFEYDALRFDDGHIKYENIRAKRVIFCEGASAGQNPFFNWLPFNLVKGELLELEVEDIPPVIFNKNIFILPLEKGKCLAGATYNWDDLSKTPTKGAREELKTKINSLLKIKYKVIGQRAGIRPSTDDRRPFLGVHPEIKNVFIFGGLGTKGVSIAPYYSDHFFQYLEHEKELDKDVNIHRHYSLYYLNNSI